MNLESIARGMMQFLDRLDRMVPARRERRSRSWPSKPAAGFTRYQDHLGRFELSYPTEWVREESQGLQVHSPLMGSFAWVDFVPPGAHAWELLESSLKPLGGNLQKTRSLSGPPEKAWGVLELSVRRFRWSGIVWGGVLLLLGNVVDPKRGSTLERYEDRILAAIRNSFKGAGSPRGSRSP